MNNHLEKHIIWYLGLAQLIAGYVAANLDGPWVKYALQASGLLTLIVKYIKDNIPADDPPPKAEPAQPAGVVVK